MLAAEDISDRVSAPSRAASDGGSGMSDSAMLAMQEALSWDQINHVIVVSWL